MRSKDLLAHYVYAYVVVTLTFRRHPPPPPYLVRHQISPMMPQLTSCLLHLYIRVRYTKHMVSIIPIVPKFPHVTIEVLDNHRLMDGIRIDVGTPVIMLVTSDIENLPNASSTCCLLAGLARGNALAGLELGPNKSITVLA